MEEISEAVREKGNYILFYALVAIALGLLLLLFFLFRRMKDEEEEE